MPPPKAGTRKAKKLKGVQWVGVAEATLPLQQFRRVRNTLKARIPETIAEENENASVNRSASQKAPGPTAPTRRTQLPRIRNENVPDYVRKAVQRANYPANIFDTIAARQGIDDARRTQLIQWVSEQYTPKKLALAEAKQRGKNLVARRAAYEKQMQELIAKHTSTAPAPNTRGGLSKLMTKAVNYFTKKRK